MSFNVIGVGPGDSELLTIKAVRLIESADVIIVPIKKQGSKESTALSIAKPYIKELNKVHYYYFPMFHGFENDPEIQEVFEGHGKKINALVEAGNEVVFLTLGDPAIYCTYTYIDAYVKSVTYVPGIPSFINGAALAGQSLVLGDASLCILNMTDKAEAIKKKFEDHENIVVMKVSANQRLLKELLTSGDRKATIMSNIGLENQRITTDIDVLDNKVPYFTIALIR